jgi:hypothetical protein
VIYLRETIAGLLSPWVVLSKTRFSRQLAKFAHTELYTSFDIQTVAERQDDPELRAAMERHADDERRHYVMFREWAAKVSPYSAANYGDPGVASDASQLDPLTVRLAASQAAAPAQRFSTIGEYMTYVFLSESRAVLQFRCYQFLNPYDERCRHGIPVLLRDERRHVRYSLAYALRELRRAPLAFARGSLRVFGYIFRQDAIDLLSVIQTVGSSVVAMLIYYGVVTPYALLLRGVGQIRRGTLRAAPSKRLEPTASAPATSPLDDAFWRRPS